MSKPSLSKIEQDLSPTSAFARRNHAVANLLRSELYVFVATGLLLAYALFCLVSFELRGGESEGGESEGGESSGGEYSEFVQYAQWGAVWWILADSMCVSIDEGFGHRLSNAVDLYFALILPVMLYFAHGTGEARYPFVSLRVACLLPRSETVRASLDAALSSALSSSLSGCGRGGAQPGQPGARMPRFSSRRESPSDIPVLRLVQLMKRTITSSASIYTHAETMELKFLLLQICQHRLYETRLPAKAKFQTVTEQKEHKEFQKVAQYWTKHEDFSTAADPIPPRRSTYAGGAHRMRGISCPDRVVNPGKEGSKMSIQASVDAYVPGGGAGGRGSEQGGFAGGGSAGGGSAGGRGVPPWLHKPPHLPSPPH
jgi:hypothetical protein